MQVTLPQIQDAHAKVKSGADFPQYVQTLKSLGVKGYSILLAQNETVYFDTNNQSLLSKQNEESFIINDTVNEATFKIRLSLHQQGGTDYATFCRDCAENGIAGWTLNFEKMTCVYFDKDKNDILGENIPSI